MEPRQANPLQSADSVVAALSPGPWDGQRFLDRELPTVRSIQTVATTAGTMSTAKPLIPEISLIMLASSKAPYPSSLMGLPEPH